MFVCCRKITIDDVELVLGEGEEFIPTDELAVMVDPPTARGVKHHMLGTWYFEWTRENGYGKHLGSVKIMYVGIIYIHKHA